MSELPRSAPGADPSARERVNHLAAPKRWLLTTERAGRAIGLPGQAIRQATRGEPLRATELTGRRGRLLIDRADAGAEIDARGTGMHRTRLPTRAPRPARQLGIAAC